MSDKRRRVSSKGEISYQVRFIDKSKKSGFGYKSFKRAKDADLFKAKKDLEETQLSYSELPLISVPGAIEKWLNICENIGRDGREPVEQMTLVEYERRAKVMKQYVWKKMAGELAASDVVQFRSWLLENHSRDLARRTLSSFGSVLKEMTIQGYLASNPALGISIRSDGRYDTQRSDIAIPSDGEVQAILEATQSLKSKSRLFEKAWQRYRPMILLIVFAGLRMSEVRGQTGEIASISDSGPTNSASLALSNPAQPIALLSCLAKLQMSCSNGASTALLPRTIWFSQRRPEDRSCSTTSIWTHGDRLCATRA